MRFCLAKRARPVRSPTGIATFSPNDAVPALPGAQKICCTSGDCLSFQASACSRPPLPTTRILIARLASAPRVKTKSPGLHSLRRRPVGWYIRSSLARGGPPEGWQFNCAEPMRPVLVAAVLPASFCTFTDGNRTMASRYMAPTNAVTGPREPTCMQQAEIVVLLFTMVAALVFVARRIAIPYPVLLVLGGLGLSFIPRLPEMRLQPDVVFYFFLPALIYPAALSTSWRDFRRNLRAALLLAIVAVS